MPYRSSIDLRTSPKVGLEALKLFIGVRDRALVLGTDGSRLYQRLAIENFLRHTSVYTLRAYPRVRFVISRIFNSLVRPTSCKS
ncbi:hypothetical protein QN277_027183 [Acacia crassicarpa]|uniref:Uncharacterized protein n=1 Tax=Acacia crassicarpa TaxID=499986 RepID=A0AAE1JCX5_9FABA|nr:hypothetical protein QN277_027183 [Acacia crassicarpa]